MTDSFHDEKPTVDRDIRKEHPTVADSMGQMLGCLPVLGSIAVGISGLVGFGVAMNHIGDVHDGSIWLIGGSIGLIASGIGFGVLGWIVWSNRLE